MRHPRAWLNIRPTRLALNAPAALSAENYLHINLLCKTKIALGLSECRWALRAA